MALYRCATQLYAKNLSGKGTVEYNGQKIRMLCKKKINEFGVKSSVDNGDNDVLKEIEISAAASYGNKGFLLSGSINNKKYTLKNVSDGNNPLKDITGGITFGVYFTKESNPTSAAGAISASGFGCNFVNPGQSVEITLTMLDNDTIQNNLPVNMFANDNFGTITNNAEYIDVWGSGIANNSKIEYNTYIETVQGTATNTRMGNCYVWIDGTGTDSNGKYFYIGVAFRYGNTDLTDKIKATNKNLTVYLNLQDTNGNNFSASGPLISPGSGNSARHKFSVSGICNPPYTLESFGSYTYAGAVWGKIDGYDYNFKMTVGKP